MALNHIMVWKFSAAPQHLQRLHRSPQNPEWIVLIPRELHRGDIDEAVFAAGILTTVSRYETKDGDVVYIGNAPLEQIMATSAGDRFAARPDRVPS